MLPRLSPLQLVLETAVQNHRITEYPELEEAHKDQLLAPQKTTQQSDHMSQSAVQALFELWQLSAITTPLGSLFSAWPLLCCRPFL